MTALQHLRKRFEPQLRRAFHLYWRMARGMTLGVRGVVLDGDDKVFLVRHSYVAGWHLPGGGVEVGETFLEALRRELVEEGRIELTGEPVLHGLFFNGHVSRRDHVAVYVVRQIQPDPKPQNPELTMIDRTAAELLTLLSRGEVTSEALTNQFLQAIRSRDEQDYCRVQREPVQKGVQPIHGHPCRWSCSRSGETGRGSIWTG